MRSVGRRRALLGKPKVLTRGWNFGVCVGFEGTAAMLPLLAIDARGPGAGGGSQKSKFAKERHLELQQRNRNRIFARRLGAKEPDHLQASPEVLELARLKKLTLEWRLLMATLKKTRSATPVIRDLEEALLRLTVSAQALLEDGNEEGASAVLEQIQVKTEQLQEQRALLESAADELMDALGPELADELSKEIADSEPVFDERARLEAMRFLEKLKT